MLLTFFLDFIFNSLNYVVSLFPVVALPSGFGTALSTFFAALGALAWFLPLGAITDCLTVIFTIYAIEFIFSFSSWLFRKVPTVS